MLCKTQGNMDYARKRKFKGGRGRCSMAAARTIGTGKQGARRKGKGLIRDVDIVDNEVNRNMGATG
eukprot:jgi/Psemu1/991/gm1.991_g